jgi:glycosyltransferase involved in cell wall biosynthesis
LLARADVCLSTQISSPYFTKNISAKIFEYFACEKPVLAAQAGETARLVEESGGGVVVPAGDPHAIANAVLTLYKHPVLRLRMGKSGRRYVEANYSRAAIAARLERVLCEVCSSVAQPTASRARSARSTIEVSDWAA